MFLPVFLLTTFLLMTALKCAGLSLCDSDGDCKDGYSCIENICKICVKCSLIFRKGSTCEGNFNNCGDCLEGYEEISVTDNSAVKKPCKLIKNGGKLKECANDNNCPPNNYCSEQLCVKCFDCSLINRQEPEKCVKDPNECGPCLIGYLLIHDKSITNHKKCEKVPNIPVPCNISSGSVLYATGLGAAVAIVLICFAIFRRGFVSSKTTHQSTSTLQSKTARQGTPIRGDERQEVQQAEVCKKPSLFCRLLPSYYPNPNASYYPNPNASYYPNDNEPDSGQNENSSVPDPSTSAQREKSAFRICLEYALRFIRSMPAVGSINSGRDSQDEQPADMNASNIHEYDSAENSSHFVSGDPAQFPETVAKEPTEDLPSDQGQV